MTPTMITPRGGDYEHSTECTVRVQIGTTIAILSLSGLGVYLGDALRQGKKYTVQPLQQ
jgi:hypothetical protein